jgi:predicted NUDIX family NTP pyrophosphohydrolase
LDNPKGEYLEDEDPLQAAKREFQEETGFTVAESFVDLGSVKQAGGKTVSAWAFEGDCDPCKIPEVDRGAWFSVDEARERIKPSQIPLLDRLSMASEFVSWSAE